MSRGWLAALALLPLLSACATQGAVADLAERTAANAGVISAHLKRLAQESSSVAELRATNIARMHAANAQRRASYSYDVALTRKSGGASNLALIPDIEAWGKEIEAIFKAADDAEKERRAEVLATQTTLDTRSQALAQIAQGLAELAREERTRDRARFLGGYAQELAKEIQTQLDQNNKSAAAAKRLLTGIQDKL